MEEMEKGVAGTAGIVATGVEGGSCGANGGDGGGGEEEDGGDGGDCTGAVVLVTSSATGSWMVSVFVGGGGESLLVVGGAALWCSWTGGAPNKSMAEEVLGAGAFDPNALLLKGKDCGAPKPRWLSVVVETAAAAVDKAGPCWFVFEVVSTVCGRSGCWGGCEAKGKEVGAFSNAVGFAGCETGGAGCGGGCCCCCGGCCCCCGGCEANGKEEGAPNASLAALAVFESVFGEESNTLLDGSGVISAGCVPFCCCCCCTGGAPKGNDGGAPKAVLGRFGSVLGASNTLLLVGGGVVSAGCCCCGAPKGNDGGAPKALLLLLLEVVVAATGGGTCSSCCCGGGAPKGKADGISWCLMLLLVVLTACGVASGLGAVLLKKLVVVLVVVDVVVVDVVVGFAVSRVEVLLALPKGNEEPKPWLLLLLLPLEPPNFVVVEVGGGEPKGEDKEDETDGGAPNREAAPPAGVEAVGGAPNKSIVIGSSVN